MRWQLKSGRNSQTKSSFVNQNAENLSSGGVLDSPVSKSVEIRKPKDIEVMTKHRKKTKTRDGSLYWTTTSGAI